MTWVDLSPLMATPKCFPLPFEDQLPCGDQCDDQKVMIIIIFRLLAVCLSLLPLRSHAYFFQDFSAGTQEDWRDDADDFPEEALGEPLGNWEGEVWVDVNNEVSHRAPA